MFFDISKLPIEYLKEINRNPKYIKMFDSKPDKLLNLDQNTKTVKGNSKGFKTGILYLSPFTLSGYNMCPAAEVASCHVACLNTAGMGKTNAVQLARLRKTLFFNQYNQMFIEQLKKEIKETIVKVKKEGYTPVFRLNGTSDIRWENYDIIQSFPEVQFYDYTKIANRKNLPDNYDLTFSYSGIPTFKRFNETAIENKMRIAVVFRNKEKVEGMIENGETFMGMPVVDGDEHDLRFLNPKQSVVALYAKHKAKLDKTGFVVD